MGVLDDRYLSAVTEFLDRDQPREILLPAVLSASCLSVLEVSGAGLSVADVLRVPLGASDPTACKAERLQTTLGEGPCLLAMETAQPLVADLATMKDRWPLFHDALLELTPYRSVASVPLTNRSHVFGALDLYSDRPGAEPFRHNEQARTDVAGHISAILSAAPLTTVSWSNTPVATWLGGPEVELRMSVWRAVGILVAGAGLDQADALAVLRGYAFAQHQALDQVAEMLTEGTLDPATVAAA